MWYFSWVLGVFLACFFAIITALWMENSEASQTDDAK